MPPATIPTSDPSSIWYPPALATQIAALAAQGSYTLQLACGFATADAAVLFTVPAGMRLSVRRPFWEVTTTFAGGTNSAIGLSSVNTLYNTKGDLLGGSGGDVAAGLGSTVKFQGTIGAKCATQGVIVLVAGNTILFDRITSVFTAGAAIAHVPCDLLPAA